MICPPALIEVILFDIWAHRGCGTHQLRQAKMTEQFLAGYFPTNVILLPQFVLPYFSCSGLRSGSGRHLDLGCIGSSWDLKKRTGF